jgi:Hormone receptor domain
VASYNYLNLTSIDASDAIDSNKSEACEQAGNFNYDESLSCKSNFDGILCWVQTKIDTTIFQPCFQELHNVIYDISSEYSVFCFDGKF